jgi:hypothetical protein
MIAQPAVPLARRYISIPPWASHGAGGYRLVTEIAETPAGALMSYRLGALAQPGIVSIVPPATQGPGVFGVHGIDLKRG